MNYVLVLFKVWETDSLFSSIYLTISVCVQSSHWSMILTRALNNCILKWTQRSGKESKCQAVSFNYLTVINFVQPRKQLNC